MKKTLKINNWKVIVFLADEDVDASDIENELEICNASRGVIWRVLDNLKRNKADEGFTYSDIANKRSVMFVGRTSSGKEFLNSFCHELRHLTDDIGMAEYLANRGEDIAYLTGEIAESLADVVCKYTCDKCRGA